MKHRTGRDRLSVPFVLTLPTGMIMKLYLIVCALIALFVTDLAYADARPDYRTRKWFGHASLGFNSGSGDFGDRADDDITLNLGITLWKPDSKFGFQFDLAYSEWDFSDSVIQQINNDLALEAGPGMATEADLTNLSLMINTLFGLGKSDLYLIAGVGADSLDAQVSTDADFTYFPTACDSWFWWCVTDGVGDGSVPQRRSSETAFAWSVGIGYAINLANGKQIILEVKYHSTELENGSVEYIPASVGLRW